jgi:hypothetical protein
MAIGTFSVPAPDDRQTIVCLYCEKPQEVARRAMTVTCKYCNKSLKLEDIRFTQYQARRNIDTCGVVTIEKKANVVADTIRCGGLVVRGRVKSEVISRGPVLVGPEAEIKGDVSATSLAVGAGASLDGNYSIGTNQQLPPLALGSPIKSIAERYPKLPVMREVGQSGSTQPPQPQPAPPFPPNRAAPVNTPARNTPAAKP